LKLRLVIPRKRRRTTFECWPPFPISIWSKPNNELSPGEENDVVAGLKHSDRIHEIDLDISASILSGSTAWVENSFPALEVLELRSSSHGPLILPNAFLMGGSDGPPRRLREIGLCNVSLPHGLLRSNRDLALLFLRLYHDAGEGSILAESLAAALSETPQLEGLFVESYPPASSYPDQRSPQQFSLADTHVILCALETFGFEGPSEYLEDLASRIDAPILRKFVICFRQSVFDVPQLSQFISRTKQLSSLPRRTSIMFADHQGLIIEHRFMPLEPPPPREPFLLSLRISRLRAASDWMASWVLHICEQLSPFTSRVEELWICIRLVSKVDENAERWLQLLGVFKGVQDLHLWCSPWDCAPAVQLERALEESTKREMSQEVFPALRILRMNEIRLSEGDTHGISAFVDARRRTGRPLVVHEGPNSSHVED
jgi:hypothetical protein